MTHHPVFKTHKTTFYYTANALKTLLIVIAIFGVFAMTKGHAEGTEKSRKSPVVVELFSSQACAYCPKADRMMGDLAKMDNVIALTCHVDYFDVKEGSLSQSFCTDRQTDYVGIFGGGTHYTPQMVINGRKDVIGYKTEKVSDALRKAQNNKVSNIYITSKKDGVYAYNLPQTVVRKEGAKLWLAVIDKPHNLTISSGANRGQKMVYTNVVSDLTDMDPWDGEAIERAVKPNLSQNHAGFAVLAQDVESGRIIAAGQYLR